MTSKLKNIFAVIFTLFLLSISTLACTCVRDKIKAENFSGRVVMQTAPQTKEPLAKVTFKLIKRTDNGDEVFASIVTNENGRFAVPEVKPGKYILQTEAPNFQRLSTEIKIVKGSSRKKELEIGLEVGATCCTGYAILRRTK
jgi:hypothetical protein